MALPMVYSRRKRMAKFGPDVYQYDTMSSKLRQQVLFVFNQWNEALDQYDARNPVYHHAVTQMREQLGAVQLTKYRQNVDDEFREWFLFYNDLDEILNSIEFCVFAARYCARRRPSQYLELIERGIEKINARALEDGFGFQIEGEQVVQISQKFTHEQIKCPDLTLLNEGRFSEANKEFRQAHEEYKAGNYDDCIHDCCNAFESVMKVILTDKGLLFKATDPASKLLTVIFDQEIIPAYMQNEFTGLRTILESGVHTVRNKEGGHGTGVNPRNIPKYIATFQLHQTAAAIILLAEAAG